MKINRNRYLAIVAIGLVAIGAGVRRTAAQVVSESGSFTLPFEVRWNSATLPAGDYTFTMESATLNGSTLLRGPNGNIFINTMAVSDQNTNQNSALSIERRGSTRFVKELYLSDRGRHFFYWAPKTKDNEKLLGQGPVSAERVPVSLGR
jgi:hypothetical protein